MKTKDNDNKSPIPTPLLVSRSTALQPRGRLPKTRREEGPQRRAKCAHLCATALGKSTNDPGMSMKTKDKYNLSGRQKVLNTQTPAILSAAKDLRSCTCAGHLGELRRDFAALRMTAAL
jgi:hypothetical protein